jgi:hypothetical protein
MGLAIFCIIYIRIIIIKVQEHIFVIEIIYERYTNTCVRYIEDRWTNITNYPLSLLS